MLINSPGYRYIIHTTSHKLLIITCNYEPHKPCDTSDRIIDLACNREITRDKMTGITDLPGLCCLVCFYIYKIVYI